MVLEGKIESFMGSFNASRLSVNDDLIVFGKPEIVNGNQSVSDWLLTGIIQSAARDNPRSFSSCIEK